jgi:hypothetical protein
MSVFGDVILGARIQELEDRIAKLESRVSLLTEPWGKPLEDMICKDSPKEEPK